MNSLHPMNRSGKTSTVERLSAKIGAITNSSDDGKSSDEESSSDEFPSSDESFEQDVDCGETFRKIPGLN